MKLASIALVLLALGCKKESADQGKGSAPAPAAAGISCADAITKAVSVMPQAPGGEQVIPKLKSILTTRCEADKWSVAARECYATQVKDMSGMKQCRESTLTPEQNTAVMTEIRAVMMAAAAAGSAGPMHGGGSAGSAGSGSAK